MQNLIIIYSKKHIASCIFFSKFSRWGAWPLAGVQLISLVLYENSHFSFRMLLKYTLKRINYNMFSKNFSKSYNQPHSKRVAITIIFLSKICYFLGNFSRHNLIKYTPKRTKLHHIFKIFSGNIGFTFKILSKYTPKRINHNMFSKFSP